jgi:hypothetical protein
MANPSSFSTGKRISEYVYYQGLQVTRPALYSAAVSRVSAVSAGLQSEEVYTSTISNLKALARNEASKEIALLVNVFGQEAASLPLNENTYPEILKGINAAMNMKGAMERALYRMNNLKKKNGESANSAITPDNFFSDYFLTAWNKNLPDLRDRLASAAGQFALETHQLISEDFKFKAVDMVEETLDKSVQDAIRALANSKVFNLKDSDDANELDGVYKDLVQSMGSIQQGGTLAHSLYIKYGLDKFMDTMMEQIGRARKAKTISKKPFSRKQMEKILPKRNGGAHNRIRGEAHEDFMKAIIEQVTSNISNGFKGGRGSVLSTGATKMKADLVIGYGLDMSNLQNAVNSEKNLENVEDAGEIRKVSLERGKNIINELSKVNDSFVVMMSAKDYGKSTISSMQGFHGGDYSLDNIGALEQYVPNMRNVVFAVMNAGEGAVGANLDGVAASIAGAIGHLLFDDVATIGQDMTGVGGKSIHLFSLNGILVPLSFFLSQTAAAMEGMSVQQMVKVKIKPAATHYPQYEPANEGEWAKERDMTLAQAKISVNFFARFLKVMNSI